MSPNDRLPFYRRLHLYARERRLTHMLRNQVAAVSSILEVVLSVLVLSALLISMVPIAGEMFSLVTNKSTDAFQTFLGHAFNLVIGIEFIKMLAKHSPGSALEVLAVRHCALDDPGPFLPAGQPDQRRLDRGDLPDPAVHLCAFVRLRHAGRHARARSGQTQHA